MANIKFSAFTQKVALGDVDFLVGYTGADNVRVAPSVLSSVYLPLAGGTMTGATNHGDNVKSIYGTGGDLEIYHDASNSYINDTGTGNVLFQSGGSTRFSIGGDVAVIGSTDFAIPQGRKLLLDGVGGHTYIEEESDNNLKFYVDGSEQLNISNTDSTFARDVGIGVTPTTKLDIGGMADPVVRIKSDAGGDPQLRFDAGAANRSALIKFYDNGSVAGGFITYEHNGDKMNFGAGSSTTTTMTVGDGYIQVGTSNTNYEAGFGVDIADKVFTYGAEFHSTNADIQVVLGRNNGTSVQGTGAIGASATNAFHIYDTTSVTQLLQIAQTTGNATFAGNVILGDDQQIQLGNLSGGDMKLYHVPSVASYVLNKTDDLRIVNQANDKDIIFETDDGSGSTATYFYLDGSAGGALPFTVFPDNSNLTFGDGYDLRQYHNGSNSYLDNYEGDLIIRNYADDKDIHFSCDDGSGGTTLYYYLDGSRVINRFPKNVYLEDNVKLLFGDVDTPDLEIYHDTGNSYIVDTGTGSLKVGAANWHLMDSALAAYMMTATPGAECNLYFNGSGRFITTSDGVKVTGQYNVAALNTAPASASAAGTLGEIRYTADYIYVCTATNTWKRTALST